jgi:hypothetical protein
MRDLEGAERGGGFRPGTWTGERPEGDDQGGAVGQTPAGEIRAIRPLLNGPPTHWWYNFADADGGSLLAATIDVGLEAT